ncbi:hypothetical protein T265_01763 [Opisthorchis viverrini]|uniref:Uncharacterized protein n=1 Tax=Opisthorchis viverrini TaxID=6198 RepID=A0A075AIS5_OPIVI|nr:hypothetical protein T265_01763 [Opisthorchis viverrini]KER32144.1 hypothetical protein T265_01763 [Opisthorchis viverrini]
MFSVSRPAPLVRMSKSLMVLQLLGGKSMVLETLQRSSHYFIDHKVKKEWEEWTTLTDTALRSEAFGELSVHSHKSGGLRIQRTYYVYKLPWDSLVGKEPAPNVADYIRANGITVFVETDFIGCSSLALDRTFSALGRMVVEHHIRNRLWVLNWQTQQDESSLGGPDQTIGQTTAYSSEADDYSVWSKQTVDCTVSLLESHADRSLASVDLLAFARGLQSGIMSLEQVLSLLDLHVSRTFPHTWKTVSRCRRQLTHWIPVNRKQIRRANYATIQTLYHQRLKDSASDVLDESWKHLYKGNCGLPIDAE